MPQKKHNLLFISLFTIIGLLALQVPISNLAGSKVSFTLFDLFGPIAPAFIGTVPGIISVFVVQILNFLFHGAAVQDAGTIIRFFPMLFAAWYFSKKSKLTLLIPIIAIIAFVFHPIGKTVWYFGLFWTIPLLAYLIRDRFLLARSLGATFTAHAVGGALWIYAFNLPANVWTSLIPIVITERIIFAVGISAAYILMTNLLAYLGAKKNLTLSKSLQTKYIFINKIIKNTPAATHQTEK